MIHVLKIHVVQKLSTIKMVYDKSIESGEGRTGASFTTGRTRFPDVVLKLRQSERQHRCQNGV